MTEQAISTSGQAAPIPRFTVELDKPNLAPWREGNTGLHGFTRLDSGRPGPHVALIALTHGNEIAGAIALDRLLRRGFTPLRGRLTVGFANLAAFDQFDPARPTASRFVDEDLNRLWDAAILDSPRRSVELARAREMRRLLETVDVLLDLHSMLWPSEPLLLSGPSPKGRELAMGIGVPPLVVADSGHSSGKRLIDYAPFVASYTRKSAVLVEAGQHWEAATVDTALATIDRLLALTGLAQGKAGALPPARFAEVGVTITANTPIFSFVEPFRGGNVIAHAGTLIATDGEVEIRTPHDDCLLVMPSLRPGRGHTAVRMARFVG